MNKPFNLSWLSDPAIHTVREMAPFSDHQVYATAQEAAVEKSSLVRCLNGAWRAHFVRRPSLAPDALLTEDCYDAELMEIQVPCEFQMVNPEWDGLQYVNTQYPWDGKENLAAPEVSEIDNPTVTAIRTFELTEAEAQQQIILTFEGVEAAMALYVNGQFSGYCECSFTPHHFDISETAKAGVNRIAARIFKRCSSTWIEDQDFWRFSGIHRSVTLTLRPRMHLEDLRVKTLLTDNYTHADLDVTMKLVGDVAGTVALALTDKHGDPVLKAEADAQAQLHLCQAAPQVKLWSADAPHLYTLTITLKDAAGQVIEVAKTQVGFRQVEMIDNILCVNGKRVVFHGVNRHEFDGERGRVMTRVLIIHDMTLMKQMNVNAIRTCHYPNTSEFYRLCDEYGFYVIDETNIESHGSWAPMHDWVVPGDKPEWEAPVIYRGSHMLERDKNHACVILWSCGNESWGGCNLQALHDYFRANDDTRFVHYENCVHDPRFPGITDIYSRMYYKVADIEKYCQSNPTKPIINCEYTHAMGNSCGGMHLYRELEDKYPMYQGGFIWDFVDQGVKITAPNGKTRWAHGGDFGDRPTDWNFIGNGIVYADRTLTPKAQEVRQVFRDVFLTPDKEGVEIWNRKDFATLTGYGIRWQIDCEQETIRQGEFYLPPVAAGEKIRVDFPFYGPLPEGQLVVTCTLVTKEDMGLLKSGTELCFGQAIVGEAPAAAAKPVTAGVPVDGDNNIGLFGSQMRALVEKAKGLISLKVPGGKENLLQEPMLSLFRAATDNDRGNRDALRQGIWHMISRYSWHKGPAMKTEDGVTTLTFVYENALLPELKIPVTYTWREENALEITMKWPGVQGQPDLPALGMIFQLDNRLQHVNYYGMGPEGNYADRCTGAYLGWHSYEAGENLAHYMKPQESGNRMGVQRLTVTGDDGHGIEITGDSLEISVHRYLPEEIAAAAHYDELQGSCRTILDVAMFRKGVGGDDSWGAPVLPQYCYASDKEYEFTFTIRAI